MNWSVAASSTYLNIRWISWLLCKKYWDLAASHICIFCQIMLTTSRDNTTNIFVFVWNVEIVLISKIFLMQKIQRTKSFHLRLKLGLSKYDYNPNCIIKYGLIHSPLLIFENVPVASQACPITPQYWEVKSIKYYWSAVQSKCRSAGQPKESPTDAFQRL